MFRVKRCAVVIGVNRGGGLTPLSGAVSGAAKFACWAQYQAMDVSLLLDDPAFDFANLQDLEFTVDTSPIDLHKDTKITIDAISSVITTYVDKMIYEQMIVFFSGHGIWNESSVIWLLSDAASNRYEAVDLSLTAADAELVGIPHVLFFSDSCRSHVTDTLRRSTGTSPFPLRDVKKETDLDFFYASHSGEPAYEVKTAEQQETYIKNYKGIFTETILDAVKGKYPDIVLKRPGRRIISPRKLGELLRSEVPKRAGEFGLNQTPNIKVMSGDYALLSEIKGPLPSVTINLSGGTSGRSLESNVPENAQASFELAKSNLGSVLKLAHTLLPAQPCIIVMGETILSITKPSGEPLNQSPQKDVTHNNLKTSTVVLPKDYTDNHLLITFSTGNSHLLRVLPDYSAILIIEDENILHVNYHQTGQPLNQETLEYEASLSTSIRLLNFGFETKQLQANALSFAIKNLALSPTYALYATYSFIANYQKKEALELHNQLLTINANFSDLPALLRIPLEAPQSASQIDFPVLQRGFNHLVRLQQESLAKRLQNHLAPSLWTSFDQKGTQLLINHFKGGEK